ncbi:MAG: type IIA DNA topoisomerase subunit B [Actinomyces sp.]|nr:DNA topoisomerase IV subunit B [Actinomyces sp.]MCI1641031.1 type IIA DNA topoisomerase subunit B [Actinomyces sp.]MCI1661399.1 type IIA DNA topoisomerase subunit B [Actinomyces sp.]MCI1690407.1 type IIA DNA topoisomerase subunit B [Actinomyces sp.]MCI1787048.1 type IIA DNA topoisomerase subunit B [Actinomyces sp.]MCI1829386.1 type IIA DNA topoisomerase subunit B [Actinomyces sp.]
MTTDAGSDYNARHLSVLEGLEAVRKRPGMYIGSTDHRGLMHCLWEIIDNSVDEALEGYCDTIDVVLHPDHSVSVRDNGRGVPVDEVPGVGLSGVEVVYTKLHAGGKFGGGSYAASGGLHGVGASVVNALSARMDVQVDRSGKTWQMCFRRGEPGEFDDDSHERTPNAPFTPFTSSSRLQQVGRVRKGVTGTRVRFWADFQIFPSTEGFSWEDLLARARQTAFLVPGLTLNCTDERGEEVRAETFRFDGGVVDFADWLASDGAVTDTWHITGEGTYQETVQQLDPDTGHLRPTDVERTCAVDCALRWGVGYDTQERSFANIIATPNGGTHVAGFEQALVKVLRAQVERNARRLKVGPKDGRLEKDDILAGMVAIVTVRLPEPQFEGQTKEILGTSQVRGVVARVVGEWLEAKFRSTRRDDKQQTQALLDKVVGEMKARVSARIHKEISRRKNALETSSLPSKLADCRTSDVGRTELFIVEGDSALGTAKAARNSEFQALFPIRGKILNVQKASTADMLANAECANIIQVVGAGSGRTFDLTQARYGKVILMTDADVDGAHIRTLLLTLFFRYMRPMVEAGRVYAAVPPLHRIEVSAQGRRPREYVYTYSEDELHGRLRALEKSGRHWKEPIQRYKGLGEMDADQLAETTMDPAHRSLRRITLEDEASLRRAEDVFELLMGSVVGPRREFIVEGAERIDRERIDA